MITVRNIATNKTIAIDSIAALPTSDGSGFNVNMNAPAGKYRIEIAAGVKDLFGNVAKTAFKMDFEIVPLIAAKPQTPADVLKKAQDDRLGGALDVGISKPGIDLLQPPVVTPILVTQIASTPIVAVKTVVPATKAVATTPAPAAAGTNASLLKALDANFALMATPSKSGPLGKVF